MLINHYISLFLLEEESERIMRDYFAAHRHARLQKKGNRAPALQCLLEYFILNNGHGISRRLPLPLSTSCLVTPAAVGRREPSRGLSLHERRVRNVEDFVCAPHRPFRPVRRKHIFIYVQKNMIGTAVFHAVL